MARGGHNFIDLTGQSFGELTALSHNRGTKKVPSTWTCQCSCGSEMKVPGYALRAGVYKHCGCKRISKRDTVKKHIKPDRVNGTRISILKQKVHKDSTSGVKGVYRCNTRNKWVVRISLAGKSKHIGYFTDLDEAIKAREKAEEQYHKPIIENHSEQYE